MTSSAFQLMVAFVAVAMLVLQQEASAVYTWTTGAVPLRVTTIEGCGLDKTKSFVIVSVPGYDKDFAFNIQTPGGSQRYELLLDAITNNKKVQLNYFNPETVAETYEWINFRNLRHMRGNCNLESQRYVTIHGAGMCSTDNPCV
jgi:hypothetical protein